ncbi:hypothetical protein RhiirC2_769196 [Rhizophagus irregularis]|uniref:Uncharacterized protein n=1 Tax=Rhizophagus irregularis TaxID=588596 RepID=A0A2N1NZR9_9GLOM|nr:hypothetical protein RhiirC2_769196 [Rhizophagus irregularis]
MSSNYEDSNIIKITRTKMVSNLQAQITSITISSNYEQYHQNYGNHNFKISQFTRITMSSRLQGQTCPQNLQGQQCPSRLQGQTCPQNLRG